MNEAELTEQLKEGSRKAFDQLYHLYFEQLYAYCLKYTKRAEAAEEIIQETFIQLWLNREKIRESDKLKHLLFVMARHRLINEFRRTANSVSYEDYLNYRNVLTYDRSGDRMMEYDEFLQTVRAAIDSLPESQRCIIRLSRIEGMKNGEIAEKLGRSEQTVKNQLSLGLKTLRKKLEGKIPLLLFALLSC